MLTDKFKLIEEKVNFSKCIQIVPIVWSSMNNVY